MTTVDVLGRPAHAAIDWPAVLANSDWFLPNHAKLLELSGATTPRDAVRWAVDHGAGHVVMTLGGDGALMATPDDVVHVPARGVAVRDTTGCGDAGVIAAVLAGCDDVTAVELGVVAGSTTARAYGSDAGLAGLDALRAVAGDLPALPCDLGGL